MKLYSKLSALGAVVVLSTAFASANTIAIDSHAGTGPGATVYAATTASGVVGTIGTDYNLSGVTPTWHAALGSSSWVGISPNAGPTGTINPAKGTYTFTDDLGSGLLGYGGTIDVLADDTTSVFLNGVLLVPPAGGGDGHCESGQPNCLTPYTVGLPGGASFSAGDNVLTFVVLQAGTGPLHGGGTGDPSGLDYSGSITTPEPSTLLLLGTGLIGSAGALLRRMRASS
ncbi:MAG TPA: PEP-CTERM sorting domain-containing protein [Edaphobacter sp.]